MHLMLHIMEDILDHDVPDVVNSSYAESAHIPFAKNTSRNTQKRVASFTRQAAHRYYEDLAILVASGDVEFEAKPQTPVTSSGPAGCRFIYHSNILLVVTSCLRGTLPVGQMMFRKTDCLLASPNL